MSIQPGQKALQTMQAFENSLMLFKKPMSPKKMKMKILTEEAYVEELSRIIQRDFFPDLGKLNAQNEYLDALEKNDIIKLRAIYAKYSGKRPNKVNGDQSPTTFETPVSMTFSTPRHKSDTEHQTPVNQDEIESETDSTIGPKKYNLDTFLTTHTSEDNYSFQGIIEAAEAKLKQKFVYLYNEENNSAKKLKSSMALPSIEKQFEPIEGVKPVDTWTYKNKNYIMYVPDGVELTKEERIELINRRQEIAHANTRLIRNPFNESQNKETITELAKSQAKTQMGKIGVDGNVVQATFDAAHKFDFVKTPSPCPTELGTPLMTWGEIEGAPFLLDGSDTPYSVSTPGPCFRINEASRREMIAYELAEKAGERLRGQKEKAIDMATRNITSPYVGSSINIFRSMSPAAKRLATIKLGLRTTAVTPSPKHTPVVHKKNYSKLTPITTPIVRRKTPLVTPQYKQQNEISEKQNLTDDLLNLPPKRPKALDFF